MDTARLESILQSVSQGALSPEQAANALRELPFKDMGFAKLDLHRHLRQGMAEVIFCPGKSAEQIALIASNLTEHHDLVLATRAEPAQARAVLDCLSQMNGQAKQAEANYCQEARTVVWGQMPEPDLALPVVALVTAGTADLPVAEEAAIVLQAHALPVRRVTDVGVAGVHRLLSQLPQIRSCDIVICVAGMDGALPSVLAGLVSAPVLAVPTSVGYGANFEGLSALLTMLTSCAAGVTVVNIDNGFGAACAAIRLSTVLCQRNFKPE